MIMFGTRFLLFKHGQSGPDSMLALMKEYGFVSK